jgi:hypothetical protein
MTNDATWAALLGDFFAGGFETWRATCPQALCHGSGWRGGCHSYQGGSPVPSAIFWQSRAVAVNREAWQKPCMRVLNGGQGGIAVFLKDDVLAPGWVGLGEILATMHAAGLLPKQRRTSHQAGDD